MYLLTEVFLFSKFGKMLLAIRSIRNWNFQNLKAEVLVEFELKQKNDRLSHSTSLSSAKIPQLALFVIKPVTVFFVFYREYLSLHGIDTLHLSEIRPKTNDELDSFDTILKDISFCMKTFLLCLSSSTLLLYYFKQPK